MKENDIEEARERLEKRIKDIWFSTTYSQEQEEKDLKILLSDYKRVLKENEHKTEKIENQKAELAILNEKQKDFNKLQNTLSSYKGQFRRQEKENEILKEEKEQAWEEWNNLEQGSYEIEQKLKQQIKKLQKENEELHKEIDQMKSLDIYKLVEDWETGQLIQIQKIKDKIEELNSRI